MSFFLLVKQSLVINFMFVYESGTFVERKSSFTSNGPCTNVLQKNCRIKQGSKKVPTVAVTNLSSRQLFPHRVTTFDGIRQQMRENVNLRCLSVAFAKTFQRNVPKLSVISVKAIKSFLRITSFCFFCPFWKFLKSGLIPHSVVVVDSERLVEQALCHRRTRPVIYVCCWLGKVGQYPFMTRNFHFLAEKL